MVFGTVIPLAAIEVSPLSFRLLPFPLCARPLPSRPWDAPQLSRPACALPEVVQPSAVVVPPQPWAAPPVPDVARPAVQLRAARLYVDDVLGCRLHGGRANTRMDDPRNPLEIQARSISSIDIPRSKPNTNHRPDPS